MIVKMTSKRQVTFPRQVVEKLRLKEGDVLRISETASSSNRTDLTGKSSLRCATRFAPIWQLPISTKSAMPPRSTAVYGIDTSVSVRLLTGHPEKEFQATATALESLFAHEPTGRVGRIESG